MKRRKRRKGSAVRHEKLWRDLEREVTRAEGPPRKKRKPLQEPHVKIGAISREAMEGHLSQALRAAKDWFTQQRALIEAQSKALDAQQRMIEHLLRGAGVEVR